HDHSVLRVALRTCPGFCDGRMKRNRDSMLSLNSQALPGFAALVHGFPAWSETLAVTPEAIFFPADNAGKANPQAWGFDLWRQTPGTRGANRSVPAHLQWAAPPTKV